MKPFEIGQRKVTDIQFRNVTRLELGGGFDRSIGKYCFILFYFHLSKNT